jgi:hypothetical protein
VNSATEQVEDSSFEYYSNNDTQTTIEEEETESLSVKERLRLLQ